MAGFGRIVMDRHIRGRVARNRYPPAHSQPTRHLTDVDAMKAAMRWIWCSLIGVVACGPSYRPSTLRATVDQRDLAGAAAMLDEPLERADRHRSLGHGYGGLVLLERGSLRWAQGDYSGCASDLQLADHLLDRQAMTRVNYLRAGKNPESMVYMYERGWAQAVNLPFGPKFYERLLLNPIAALCRLEVGDRAGACVEARRFGVMSDYTESLHAGQAKRARAFGELMSTFACRGVDPALSCRAAERARELGVPVAALDKLGACDSKTTDVSELWVLAAYGRPSHPAFDQNFERIWIEGGAETLSEPVVIEVDGTPHEAVEVIDIEAAVQDDYQDAENALTVRFMGMTATAGRWSQDAWQVLPAHVVLAIVHVAPGEHAISTTLRGTSYTRNTTLSAGRPGIASFYVPW